MQSSMQSSWQNEKGQIECRWSAAHFTADNPLRLEPDAEGHSRYLPPIPHFASHSPFGGAYWFMPIPLMAYFE